MEFIYFDNAATTFPKPLSVRKAVNRVISNYCANPGRSSHDLSLKAAEEVYLCREKLSDFFNGKDENTVFTSSATHSINLGIKTVLRKGDHVLISDIEHNSVIRPIWALAERGLITYTVYTAFESPEKQIAEIASKLTERTSLVCACHHSNISCITLPINEIGHFCRKNKLHFLVDASQSAGLLPIDVENDCIDILCAPAHKGLYGIPGGGFAIFGENIAKNGLLSSFIEGGNGINSENPSMPDFLPERFEAGTLPLPAISALSAGVDFVKTLSPQKILKKEKSLCAALRKELLKLDRITIHSDNDGSILLFSVKGTPSEDFAQALASYKICVRAGLHCSPLAHAKLHTPSDGAVRVSFGAFNTFNEVERFAFVCKKILRSKAYL